jgi:hypothetical protein
MSRDHWTRGEILYENMEEMKRYFTIQIQASLKEEKDKTIPFPCDNKDRSFMMYDIVFYHIKNDKEITPPILCIELNYKMYHCDATEYISYDIMGLRDAEDVIQAIFYCLFDMEPCRECYNLTDSKHHLCMQCIPQKIRDEYALVHKQQQGKTCSICFEPVYVSSLSCGHFFHKTCFIKQNPYLWYSSRIAKTNTIKCPLCRIAIQPEDEYLFFMYHQDE